MALDRATSLQFFYAQFQQLLANELELAQLLTKQLERLKTIHNQPPLQGEDSSSDPDRGQESPPASLEDLPKQIARSEKRAEDIKKEMQKLEEKLRDLGYQLANDQTTWMKDVPKGTNKENTSSVTEGPGEDI